MTTGFSKKNFEEPGIDPFREVDSALNDFLKVAELAGYSLAKSDLVVEMLSAPHEPPKRLPSGKMAIYAFCGPSGWLKVGKVGPKSNARYTSQHYNKGSAPSTLAASLWRHHEISPILGLTEADIKSWICENCTRVNVLFSTDLPFSVLSLAEAFLHVRLNPQFEGMS